MLQAAWSWAAQAQDAQNELKAAVRAGEKEPDPVFIASLEELANEALFVEPATTLTNQWKQILRDRMDNTLRIVVNKVAFKQEQTLNKQLRAKHDGDFEEAFAKVRRDFIQALGEAPIPEGSTGCASRVQAPSTRNNSDMCLYRSILTYFSIEQARNSTSYESSYYGYNALNSGQISIKLWRAQALTLDICSVICCHRRTHIQKPTIHPLHVASSEPVSGREASSSSRLESYSSARNSTCISNLFLAPSGLLNSVRRLLFYKRFATHVITTGTSSCSRTTSASLLSPPSTRSISTLTPSRTSSWRSITAATRHRSITSVLGRTVSSASTRASEQWPCSPCSM